MPSGKPDSKAILRDPRFEAAARLAAARFGLDLARYPAPQVHALLAVLADAEATHDVEALARIASVCCIGETTFLRHPEHFAALGRLVAGASIGEARRPLQAWSAGCATGEEAYSLAAVLGAHPAGVRVLGTDLNATAIAHARAGKYGRWSLRGVDPAAVESWLSLHDLGATVSPELSTRVELAVHNLVTDRYPEGLDVVFCRNVLLYFDADAAEAVIARMYSSLRPGGVLFLGYFDPSPGNGAPFVEERSLAVRYFRKPVALHAPPPLPVLPAPAIPVAPVAIVPAPVQLRERLATARGLSDRGARGEALRLLAEACREHPLEVEPHVLTAMIAEEEGLSPLSLEAARRAYFLAPDEPVTAFWLGVCLDRAGDVRQARLRFRQALGALERYLDPSRPLPHGEGITASMLRRMIDGRIA
jgi:chemotaxis protein methyltransferase CheR